MRPVSEAQRRAMYAAAAGKSTLGIPKKVGQEFTDADKPGKLPARKTEASPAAKADVRRDAARKYPVHFPPLSHLGRQK